MTSPTGSSGSFSFDDAGQEPGPLLQTDSLAGRRHGTDRSLRSGFRPLWGLHAPGAAIRILSLSSDAAFRARPRHSLAADGLSAILLRRNLSLGPVVEQPGVGQ